MAVGGQVVSSVREQRVESEEVHAVSGLPSPPLTASRLKEGERLQDLSIVMKAMRHLAERAAAVVHLDAQMLQ